MSYFTLLYTYKGRMVKSEILLKIQEKQKFGKGSKGSKKQVKKRIVVFLLHRSSFAVIVKNGLIHTH